MPQPHVNGHGHNARIRPNSQPVRELTKATENLATVLASVSPFSRVGAAASLHQGLFGGDRDFAKQFGYPTEYEFRHFQAFYERDGLAARIVDLPVEHTWDRDLETKGIEGANPPFRFRDVSRELARNNVALLRSFKRVDTLAQLGKYAVLLIGLRGTEDFQQPVEGRLRLQDVVSLSPIAEPDIEFEKLGDDPADPMFNRPTLYKVTIRQAEREKTRTLRVHHSRVVHVADGGIMNDIEGTPRLQRLLDNLFNAYKLAGSSAEIFWKDATQDLWAKVLPEADLNSARRQELEGALVTWLHSLARTFVTDSVDLQKLEGFNPDPRPTWEVIEKLITAASDIPRSILFGNEAGTLAGSVTDRKTFADMVEDRRTEFAEPLIARPFFNRLQTWGALPKDDYDFTWPPAFRLTELERAEVEKSRAEAWAKYSDLPSELDADGTNERRDRLGLPPVDQVERVTQARLDENDQAVVREFSR